VHDVVGAGCEELGYTAVEGYEHCRQNKRGLWTHARRSFERASKSPRRETIRRRVAIGKEPKPLPCRVTEFRMVRKDDIDGVAAVNDAADDRSHERRRGIADVLGKPLTDQQHAHGRSSTPLRRAGCTTERRRKSEYGDVTIRVEHSSA